MHVRGRLAVLEDDEVADVARAVAAERVDLLEVAIADRHELEHLRQHVFPRVAQVARAAVEAERLVGVGRVSLAVRVARVAGLEPPRRAQRRLLSHRPRRSEAPIGAPHLDGRLRPLRAAERCLLFDVADEPARPLSAALARYAFRRAARHVVLGTRLIEAHRPGLDQEVAVLDVAGVAQAHAAKGT